MATDYEIKSLLEKTKPIVAENKRIREEREASGDFFNVFSILRMKHYEVRTHSPFLAELLNPNGSHGKKDTFLRLFVEAMPLQGIDKAALDTSDAKVLTEEPTEEGRLDIMIDFPASKYIIIYRKQNLCGRPGTPAGAVPQLCGKSVPQLHALLPDAGRLRAFRMVNGREARQSVLDVHFIQRQHKEMAAKMRRNIQREHQGNNQAVHRAD